MLSSQVRGEHDRSGKKHGSAVLTDGVTEQGQVRVTGPVLARGLRGGTPGGGQKAETERLTSPIEWQSPGKRVRGLMQQGREGGLTLGVPLPVGEANERWVLQRLLPARILDRSMVVPSVTHRSREVVR